jgi:hypothetical protein
MVPVINGKVYHFGPRGLYNGLLLLGDDETHSWWDHMTGECLHGPSKGVKMEVYPIRHTTVEEALGKWPDIRIALSRPNIRMRWLSGVMNWMHRKEILPPGFAKTMQAPDERLPRMTSGLGIIEGREQCFYPLEVLRQCGGTVWDTVGGAEIRITLDASGIYPDATYTEAKEPGKGTGRPLQLYTRWYGFSYTYPRCKIYGQQK